MNAFINFWKTAALAGSLAVVLPGCGESDLPAPELDLAKVDALSFGPSTDFHNEQAVVKVSLAVAWLDDEWAVIRGVFDPNQAGFHLYGKDLPEKGVDGIGRPTLMKVASGASQAGDLVANQTTEELTVVDLKFPVYPEGPVSLFQAIRPDGDSLSLELTFMSCSNALCNRPVEKAAVTVAIPNRSGGH